MNLFEAIVLGVVQGLTEFLPISSTAHLRVVPALLGWQDPGAAFTAVIQLGTVGAVLVYFAADLKRLTIAFVQGILKRQPFGTADSRLAWFVGLGTIPIGVFGLLLKKRIETDFRSLVVIAGALIVLGIILWVVDRTASQTRSIETLSLKDAMLIGLGQSLALIPGSSRSGTTITAGLLMGLKREDAARYSFLLSIPATTLAGLLELKHLFKEGLQTEVAPVLTSTAASFVVGLLAIWGLLKFVKQRSMVPFAVYRLALGALLLVLISQGVLSA